MQPDKAGTAPAFLADHPAATKADRVMDAKDGLTAWEVIELLFPIAQANSFCNLEPFSAEARWVDLMPAATSTNPTPR